MDTSLRAFRADDGAAVVELVVEAGLFNREEAAFLAHGALEPDGNGSTCLVQDDADGEGLAAVLFYRPEEAADRAFDLTMIAVRPDVQGSGRGTALMRYAEQDLRSRGQRLLIVRTSGTDDYRRTRAFYKGIGYTQHSQVPDYWSDGDDLVMFSKRLSA